MVIIMKTPTILANTFGIDINDISDYRYQSTRTSQAIYAIGEQYFAIGKRKPKDVFNTSWEMFSDQFWAKQGNTVIWVSN
jgi:hypothetical protein